MRRPIQLRWATWLLAINAGVAILLSGCATPDRHSFNQDFNDKLPVDPKYYVHDEDANRFFVTVNQGTPSTGAERVINVKQAATTVATAECKKLGWDKWHLDYIQERDQGWMHVVIAKVTRD